MKINIKTKNIELNQALTDFIEDKIGGLEKFLQSNRPIIMEVEIAKTTRHHNKGDVFYAEAQIQLPGTLLRSSAKREDLRIAIGQVKDELQRQIRKYKEKPRDESRRSG